jgi:hypothetical protein
MGGSTQVERDHLVVCLELARRAAGDLQRELRGVQHSLEETLEQREQGLPVSQVLSQESAASFPELVTDPTAHFGEAIHDCRAELIRCLVDEEGWTLTEVATETGHARQLVSRLYHSAGNPRPCLGRPGPDDPAAPITRLDNLAGHHT